MPYLLLTFTKANLVHSSSTRANVFNAKVDSAVLGQGMFNF